MSPDEPRRRSPLDLAVATCAVIGLLLLLPGLFGFDHWFLELLIHWQVWVAGAMAVPLMWFLVRRRRIVFALALLGVVRGLWVVWPYVGADPIVPAATLSTNDRPLVVVTVNLLQELSDNDAAFDWVLSHDPDVISIQEVTPGNIDEVRERVGKTLPHHHFQPELLAFGMGLASRWPMADLRMFGASVGSPVQFAATIKTPDGDLRYFNVHPPPPVTARRNLSQRQTLEKIAARVKASTLPVVVAGDFNLTPWSPTFRRFLDETDLRDPRIGRGLYATWSPPSSPWPLIPIDYVLLSKEWRLVDLQRGPNFGSDHRALVARLVR